MPSPDDFAAWFELFFGIKPSREITWLGITTLILIIVFCRLVFSDWKNCKNRSKLIHSKLADYSRYITWKQNRLYIPAHFQANPPEFSADISYSARTQPTSDLLKFYLKQVLVERNSNKQLYMILGGSGMGKTSFVVQLVRRYYSTYIPGKEPFELYLFPCGNANLLERISTIPNK